MAINLGQVIQDVMLAEQIAGQLIADDAALKAGQPAAATIPISLYGYAGNLSIIWNPNGSGVQPSQAVQQGAVVSPQGQVQIGRSAGVPIQIGPSTNGLSASGAGGKTGA